ncbi:MAG TPA: hypothetical protein VEI50_09765 [Nitrospiraceae bacterium]|jgi:hypothetical protein|nr:hypothetical protein [Nitrospiraceae bacterium]
MKPEQLGLSLGVAALLGAIFLIDVRTGLGFTPWLLYVIPLGLTYWASYLYAPLVTAVVCTILVFIGYILSPPLIPQSIALTNRIFGAITFLALGVLIVAYKLLAQRLTQLTDQLRRELLERTQDLGRAVRVFRAEAAQRSGLERDLSEASEEFTRHLTDVLVAESRRLQEHVGHLEQASPAASEEDRLEHTRNELERLGKQLEQLQRDLLRQ